MRYRLDEADFNITKRTIRDQVLTWPVLVSPWEYAVHHYLREGGGDVSAIANVLRAVRLIGAGGVSYGDYWDVTIALYEWTKGMVCAYGADPDNHGWVAWLGIAGGYYSVPWSPGGEARPHPEFVTPVIQRNEYCPNGSLPAPRLLAVEEVHCLNAAFNMAFDTWGGESDPEVLWSLWWVMYLDFFHRGHCGPYPLGGPLTLYEIRGLGQSAFCDRGRRAPRLLELGDQVMVCGGGETIRG
jgi:hypothetical protein